MRYRPGHYNLSMRLLAVLLTVSALGWSACARDVTGGDLTDVYPTQVTTAFRVQGTISSDFWYYMIFNFSAAPSTAAASAPLDFVSDEDRGRNWELYVALHRDTQGNDQLYTLERPRVPTVLPTDLGPADAAAADFTSDLRPDIIVACEAGDHVQLIRANQFDIYDPVYYNDPEFISEGPAPIRVFTGLLAADSNQDAVVLFKGTDPDTGFLRVLTGDGLGGFTAADIALPAIPLDLLGVDVNADSRPDAVVLTGGATAAERRVRIYLNDGNGILAAGTDYAAGDDPVALATGHLASANADLVVADRGDGSAGAVKVLEASGTGTYTAGPDLAVSGEVHGVSCGYIYGNQGVDDILVCYTDSLGKGQVGVFQNEQANPYQTPAVSAELPSPAAFVLTTDTGTDSQGDAVLVNGTPGGGGSSLYIKRGLREPAPNPLDPRLFAWDTEDIIYLTGLEPSRIRLCDLDSDGQIDDFLIPNSADGTNGNSVNLFFGLGNNDYSSADIYWTDDPPELLTNQDWYISHTVGPNFFELTFDPGLLYSMAQIPPDLDDGVNVTFMTGTTGIAIADNLDQLGQIRDFLSSPVNIPMEIGFFDDEQNSQRAQTEIAEDNADIDNWRVEVF
jgi:hypothetical protein